MLIHLKKKYVFTHNVFLEQSFACQTDKKARYFLAEITNWSNLKVLFVIDFSKFSKILCRKELVDKIKPLIDDQFILNLVNSFLHSPILDKEGRNRALDRGIPPVRFLLPLLFNFFLDKMDRNFSSKFPDWTFARFYHQMFVPIGTGISRDCRITEEILIFLQNAFIAEGGELHILCPGIRYKINRNWLRQIPSVDCWWYSIWAR